MYGNRDGEIPRPPGHGDDKPNGTKRLGGSGEMIELTGRSWFDSTGPTLHEPSVI
jgi:hypothetical protein